MQSDFVYENINIQGRALFSMGFFFSGGRERTRGRGGRGGYKCPSSDDGRVGNKEEIN